MIKEDYVSLEIAKLLKENGFDEECSKFWLYNKNDTNEVCLVSCGLLGDTNLELNNSQIDTILNDNKNGYSAPTLQMAMKWLREVHNLCLEPYRTACGYLCDVARVPSGSEIYGQDNEGDDEDSGEFTTYEKSCEAAIKYCLENLI